VRAWLQVVQILLRPTILLMLTVPTVLLALGGHQRAIDALLAEFVAVVAFYFGERAGLAQPPTDP
jgi:uncharacterized membrane protein YvlD (DUF360 family)